MPIHPIDLVGRDGPSLPLNSGDAPDFSLQQILFDTMQGHLPQVQQFLAHPNHQNIVAQDRQSILLQTAVRINHVELTALLLPHYNPFVFNANAFRLAIHNNCPEIFALLCTRLSETSPSQIYDLTKYAVAEQRPGMVAQLLPHLDGDIKSTLILHASTAATCALLVPHASISALEEAFRASLFKDHMDLIDALFEHINPEVIEQYVLSNNTSTGFKHLRHLAHNQATKKLLQEHINCLNNSVSGSKPLKKM